MSHPETFHPETSHAETSHPETEPDCVNVSRLFLRMADAIDDLGHVEVLDLVLRKTPTARGGDLALIVYYGRPGSPEGRRGRDKRRKDMPTTANEDEEVDTEDKFVCDDKFAEHLKDTGVHSLNVNNPFAETGLYSVPKLLRRTADLLEILGGLITPGTVVAIGDIVLERKQDPAEGPVPSITCYYRRFDDVERLP